MQNNETDPIVLENDSSFKTSTITKNQVLEKGNEKVSSVGKLMRLNDKTEAPTKPKTRTESRNKKYEKVVKIIGNLAPFMADVNSTVPNRDAFIDMYQSVIFLTSVQDLCLSLYRNLAVHT